MQRNYIFNIVSRLKKQGKIEVGSGKYYAKDCLKTKAASEQPLARVR